MMLQAEPGSTRRVTVGVDTHLEVHVARAKDELGRLIAETSVATTPAGYSELLAWARRLGEVAAFGIEGTGSYGAALSRYLAGQGETVREVIRPNRQRRRRNGKSDPADADAAASAVLSGEDAGVPKGGDDKVEMIRTLRVARATGIKARTQAANALHALVVTAPAGLRESLRHLSRAELVRTCAAFRPGQLTDPTVATKTALRSLAGRYQALDAEIKTLDASLERLITSAAPRLVAIFGVGPDCAGALLVAAGDNPERLHSEQAFSMLCGASPVEASSGKVTRHRLNRGGNRQANAALHRVVVTRIGRDKKTQEYMARRQSEGKSNTEIVRCLKRYVAREVYHALKATKPEPAAA